jgi:hypothetical protein
MNTVPIQIAKIYYQAMGDKDVARIEPYLHSQVELISPLAHVTGKEAFMQAIERFSGFLNTLTIRTAFGSGDQTVVIYDTDFPMPIGTVSSASLMTFSNGLIIKVELFFDARPFDKK